MPKFIVEIRNPKDDADRRLIEWSTVVDAPVTYGMRLREFVEHYLFTYGQSSAQELLDRLARVRKKGTSEHDAEDWEDSIAVNRAGPDETEATPSDIWHMCVDERPTGAAEPQRYASSAIRSVRDYAATWEGA